MGILKKVAFVSLQFLLLFITVAPEGVSAANISQGVAIDVAIEGRSIVEGSIISLNDGRYTLSTIPYDNSVFGVVTEHPSVVFKDRSTENKYSVITIGKTSVRVSSINGAIKTGDLLTTSTIPGVAQKATENGYVIGIAAENYENSNPNQVGLIFTTLHLNFGMLSSSIRENLISSLVQGSRAPFSSPLNTLRYVLAAAIALLSFAFGFWFFGRISSRGVEAVGRNPLARRFILISVLMNVLITIGVMMFGVAIAYLILVI